MAKARLTQVRAVSRLLGGTKRVALASVAISAAQSVLLIPIALLVRRAFNETIPNGDSGSLVWIGVAVVGLFLASSALGLLTRWLSLRATKRAIAELRARLLQKILLLPRAYFDRTDLGTMQSMIVQDSERLDVMANALVSLLLPAVTISLALGIVLVVLSPLLALLLALAGPPLFVLSALLARRLRSRTRKWQRHFDVFSSHTQLALRSISLTKLHGAEAIERERHERRAIDLSEAGRKMAWLQSAYTLLNGTIAAAAGVVVLVVGGAAVANHTMSLGDLLAFYAVLGLLRGQINSVLTGLPQVIAGAESLARLERLLSEPSAEPYSGSRKIEFTGAVALEGVRFAYAAQPVLREVTMSVAPGETVALIGPNGAGKSTVLSLIAGLYRPSDGCVTADGVPLEEIDLRSLRRRTGVVVQDPFLFPASVSENIAYGRPHAGPAEVERAARLAAAHDFIERLPDGYATRVGDDGSLLSGGQRQRIALARALVEGPVLLMLDEPTTYLDEEGTEALLRTLRELDPRPAILVVSHDAWITSSVDRVYGLRQGALEELTATAGARPRRHAGAAGRSAP